MSTLGIQKTKIQRLLLHGKALYRNGYEYYTSKLNYYKWMASLNPKFEHKYYHLSKNL
jgi:hypothetical protein